ncbi:MULTISPECIES: glycerol-3-phosphate 1-O-acyltransferase PlsB [Cycloclasticus]|uniref:Glycerol-3-phosphate acyltransferase n=1 Tax=Cycloclasticus pugetii TaxID=34068 RepID=A0AB33Z602_9GAMM|nr:MULTISPECIES: glycerol-3-phosphate 1-O-acyltransferase PlsB [Cycloclasticus]ATI03839.1 glycerol-3-phosphate 1-O-acyltransferase PlsB [Cycloclasticus sp. PY97N]EPD14272.1 glycerol-3-phosphate acyltransferase [Cycloclasticus pugetii]
MGPFLLRWLLSFWVKATVLPKGEKWLASLKNQKVCYVTFSDACSKQIVLEQTCKNLGLPLPSNGIEVESAVESEALFSLESLKERKADPAPARLARLIDAAQSSNDDILIVPVSIFWGRGPRKSDGFWSSLFTDEGVKSNLLSRALSILFNGRTTLLRFGDPVSLKQLNAGKPSVPYTTRKLTRVLRVHFARTRLITIGPDQLSPKKIAEDLLKTQIVQQAIQREIKRKKLSKNEAEKQAKAYAIEIAAVINIRAAMVLEKVLGWLWNKLYDGIVLHHFARVERLSRKHQIIYVPSHQSHMDYLVLSYTLYTRGLAVPHVAAGINLNIPIAGPWIRRCGAFFLRRTFKGNVLYGSVFEAYMGYLANRGTAVEYFVEGGRSRTGRKLKAKPGLLAMSVRSYLRDHKRSVVFIPVNFAYEKLVEGETYVNELSGKPKKSESVMGVLRSFKALKDHFGQVHVNFGSPIYLDKLIEAERPQWRREDCADNKELVNAVVSKLGTQIMSGINEATHVNCVGLLAMALLNTPEQSMSEADLMTQLDLYLALLDAAPYSKDVTRIELNAKEIIAYGEEFGIVKRGVGESGERLYVEGSDAVLMTYFRNNIVHLFVLPSFVACCFLSHQSLKKKQVVHWFRLVYPFLKDELSMHWTNRQITYTANKVIACLVDQGLINQSADTFSVNKSHHQTIGFLSRGVLLSLERFYLTVLLLKKNGVGHFTRFELEKNCGETAQRLSELNGLNSPEFFDKVLFKGFIEMLYNQGIIWLNDNGKLMYGEVLDSIVDDAGLVMSQQVRKNVHGLVEA